MTKRRISTNQAGASASATPPAAQELFDAAATRLLEDPMVAEGKMFGSRGLKVSGKIFAMLVKGKLVVKLPKERVEALVGAGAGGYFDPGHGRLMKEWVAVEPASAVDWLSLVDEARSFARAQR